MSRCRCSDKKLRGQTVARPNGCSVDVRIDGLFVRKIQSLRSRLVSRKKCAIDAPGNTARTRTIWYDEATRHNGVAAEWPRQGPRTIGSTGVLIGPLLDGRSFVRTRSTDALFGKAHHLHSLRGTHADHDERSDHQPKRH